MAESENHKPPKSVGSSQKQGQAPKDKRNKLQTLLRLGGGSGVILGIAAMIFPVLFWWGTALMIAGGIMWSVDVWSEDISVLTKLVFQGIVLSIIGLFVWQIAMFPASPRVAAFWAKSDYPAGSLIDGVRCHKGLSELRVDITNPSPGPVRFRCDKLPAHSQIMLLFSLANISDMTTPLKGLSAPAMTWQDLGKPQGDPAEWGYNFLGPKEKPKWVVIHSSYTVFYRPHSANIRIKVGDL